MDTEHLLIDLTHGRIVDQSDVVEQKIEVKSEKACKGCGRAHADDVNRFGLEDRVNRPVEIFLAHLVDRAVKFLHIGGEHGVENIAAVNLLFGDLDALHGRETVSDHLLHGAAHAGIAVIPKLRSKTDDR